MLTVLLGYVVVRLFMRQWYWVAEYNYLTPLYSPCISASCTPGSTHFGAIFGDLPIWIPLPIVVFPVLLGFRGTCYYYRKAVYRSILQSPTACARRGARPAVPRREPVLPLHELAPVLLLPGEPAAADQHLRRGARRSSRPAASASASGRSSSWSTSLLLWGYTLGCHACRHIVGGKLKHFSRNPLRYAMWNRISTLNARHMQFAWASLVSVTLTDVYIMAVSAGWISDLRIVG